MRYQVAPNRVSCPPLSRDDQPCLLVKRADETQWREVNPSTFPNFAHETGYRYVLLVREQFRPPAMTYEVVRILEKTPDASLAIPGQP
nr:DUF4377 domain-containing protein [Deinococcus planocerae]